MLGKKAPTTVAKSSTTPRLSQGGGGLLLPLNTNTPEAPLQTGYIPTAKNWGGGIRYSLDAPVLGDGGASGDCKYSHDAVAVLATSLCG